MDIPTTPRRWYLSDTAILLYMALLKVIIHIPFITEYGYFRDELYYIACSKHLAWGYVDQPPLSIAVLAVVRVVLGETLLAIRILPVLAGAATVFLCGFMVKQIGGGRYAQILGSLAALSAPVYLANAGTFYSMNAFDILFWAIAGSIVIAIVRTNAERLWVLFGVVAGLGVMNKYSMGFFLIGLGVGMLLTPLRRHFLRRWFWIGAAIGGIILVPHVRWEFLNSFPTVEFIRNVTNLKNTPTSPWGLLLGQITDVGAANAIVWISGLLLVFIHGSGKPYRLFGYLFLAVFVVLALQNAKAYYLSPVYPPIFALGAYAIEQVGRRRAMGWVRGTAVFLVVGLALPVIPFAIPVLPVDSFIRYQTALGVPVPRDERGPVSVLPQRYADMFGWKGMVDSVAKVYGTLSKADQARCMIYVRNYGEAGAINFFGPALGLPLAACTHNSYWYWKPASWSGDVAIIFGSSNDSAAAFSDLSRFFDHVELAGVTHNDYAMPYENGRLIFICRGARITLDELWARDRHFI